MFVVQNGGLRGTSVETAKETAAAVVVRCGLLGCVPAFEESLKVAHTELVVVGCGLREVVAGLVIVAHVLTQSGLLLVLALQDLLRVDLVERLLLLLVVELMRRVL